MKKVILLSITLLLVSTLLLQANQDEIDNTYNRVGISIIYCDYDDSYSKQIKSFYESFKPEARYDVNSIKTKCIPQNSKRDYIEKYKDKKPVYYTPDKSAAIKEFLVSNNIGLEIISHIFNRKEDGTMDLSLVNYRGEYNASDEDFLDKTATKRGAEALKEAGEKLIANSYLVVYDDINIRYEYNTTDEDYFYYGDVAGYLFKIAWSEELLYAIWDCWIDENTPESEKEAKKAAFEAIKIPLEKVMTYSQGISDNTKVNASKKSTSLIKKSESILKQESLDRLIRKGIDACFYGFEYRDQNLALKAPIFDVKPIRVKMGTKEGLSTDNAFTVYENVQDEDGTISKRKVGIIKATNKISDNSRVTTGNFEPSQFYQYAGRRVEQGQDLVEKKMAGVSFLLGYATSNAGGINLGFELDRYAGRATQMYIGVDGNANSDAYNLGLYFGYGLRMNNFQIYPTIGGYIDALTTNQGTDEERKKGNSLFFGQVGVRSNINIIFPFQIFLHGGYNVKITEGNYYTKYKGTRNISGITAGAGIRLCF